MTLALTNQDFSQVAAIQPPTNPTLQAATTDSKIQNYVNEKDYAVQAYDLGWGGLWKLISKDPEESVTEEGKKFDKLIKRFVKRDEEKEPKFQKPEFCQIHQYYPQELDIPRYGHRYDLQNYEGVRCATIITPINQEPAETLSCDCLQHLCYYPIPFIIEMNGYGADNYLTNTTYLSKNIIHGNTNVEVSYVNTRGVFTKNFENVFNRDDYELEKIRRCFQRKESDFEGWKVAGLVISIALIVTGAGMMVYLYCRKSDQSQEKIPLV